MRAAPAVSAPIGRSPAWCAVQVLLWVLAVLALSSWMLGRFGRPDLSPLWVLALSPPVAAATWWLQGASRGAQDTNLQWDGERWQLGEEPVHVTVALDFGPWLLLALQPAAALRRRRWLPATAQQAGPHWHALRAALYSRAPEAPQVAAPPPGASAPD